MLLIGVLLMLVAVDVIPTDEADFHAPRWVVFLCGLIFALPALAGFLPQYSSAARYLIAVMLLCFGAVGVACGALGEEEEFSGGLPFVSKATNVWIARIVFISGGILCAGLSVACAMGRGTVMGEGERSVGDDPD